MEYQHNTRILKQKLNNLNKGGYRRSNYLKHASGRDLPEYDSFPVHN